MIEEKKSSRLKTIRIIAIVAAVVLVLVVIPVVVFSVITQPQLLPDGSYEPSILTLAVGTSDVSDYDNTVYPNPYTGSLKVLVVCTEVRDFLMTNGKKFSSGNHPVETFVPMLHMQAAGFDFEFATLTGKSAKFEEWALPTKDKALMALWNEYTPKINAPTPLADVSTSFEGYAAIFLPGGHGALVGLPESPVLGKLLRAAHSQALPTFALCHGPGAFLSAALGAPAGEPFAYKGSEMVMFPDKADAFPNMGYLPGPLPLFQCKELSDVGVKVLNKDEAMFDGRTHVYKELVTGDSPMASNKFGKDTAEALLKKYVKT